MVLRKMAVGFSCPISEGCGTAILPHLPAWWLAVIITSLWKVQMWYGHGHMCMCVSVVELWPSLHEALGSIPSTRMRELGRKREREGRNYMLEVADMPIHVTMGSL